LLPLIIRPRNVAHDRSLSCPISVVRGAASEAGTENPAKGNYSIFTAINYAFWCTPVLKELLLLDHTSQCPVREYTCTYFYSFLTYRYIGVYVQTLIIIFWRDIFKFLGMFTVVLVVLSGPLYLSLRYDADLANSTTSALLSGEGRWDKNGQWTLNACFLKLWEGTHTVITLSCQPETNYLNIETWASSLSTQPESSNWRKRTTTRRLSS